MRQASIERLLPAVVQRTLLPGTPLAALLAVMEALQAPAEAVLDDVAATFDPYRAPDRFAPFLAGWVDLDRFVVFDAAGGSTLPSGHGHLRNLVAAAAELSRWRGTGRGLLRLLEVATGVPGFTVEDRVSGPDGRIRPFHVRVTVPAGAVPYRRLVEHIVQSEKPAYLTAEIAFPDPDPDPERDPAADPRAVAGDAILDQPPADEPTDRPPPSRFRLGRTA
jgi:phage tail-like protein